MWKSDFGRKHIRNASKCIRNAFRFKYIFFANSSWNLPIIASKDAISFSISALDFTTCRLKLDVIGGHSLGVRSKLDANGSANVDVCVSSQFEHLKDRLVFAIYPHRPFRLQDLPHFKTVQFSSFSLKVLNRLFWVVWIVDGPSTLTYDRLL